MYDNKYIASKLKRIGQLMELMDENPFKTRAYGSGARAVEGLPYPAGEMLESGELDHVKGIGTALKQKIADIYHTGTCDMLEKLQQEIPQGIQNMLSIKGLGAKKIRVIWKEMEITTIGDLLYACNENRLVEVKGFGAKTQQSIRETLEFYLSNQGSFHYSKAKDLGDEWVKLLQDKCANTDISLTGEIRRKLPVLSKIEILISNANWNNCVELIESSDALSELEKNDGNISALITEVKISIEFNQSKNNFYFDLFQSTASETHLTELGKIENDNFQNEAAIFSNLKLAFIEPELREGLGEIELAKNDQLPELVSVEDIKGIVHCHSTWSDGIHSIEDMAKASIKMGMEYLAMSDHSRSAFYANGLSADRVLAQMKEIDGLNEKLAPFRIFKGIESDILFDGNLDYEPEILEQFDYIIASVHSTIKMDKAKATSRLITAIENPFTTILGHPTARLLLMRKGYEIDHKKVIDACAENKVAIEINANPWRLDLDWTWIPYALEKGVMISVNPDAHRIDGLDDIRWGIAAARKGRLTKEMTLNALSANEFEKYIHSKRALAK